MYACYKIKMPLGGGLYYFYGFGKALGVEIIRNGSFQFTKKYI